MSFLLKMPLFRCLSASITNDAAGALKDRSHAPTTAKARASSTSTKSMTIGDGFMGVDDEHTMAGMSKRKADAVVVAAR